MVFAESSMKSTRTSASFASVVFFKTKENLTF